MSSDDSILASLTVVQTNLFKFVGPTLVGVGTVGCIMNLLVFTRKKLRKNPCSMYLVAYNVCDILLIYLSLLISTLSIGYNIDPTVSNLGFCRFRLYSMALFDILGSSYLILAFIDRILLTSRNALTRQRSTPRLTYICIITITIFWSLLHIHLLILASIGQIAPGYSICFFQPGLQMALMKYYATIIKGILVFLLMIIFGLWAVKNVRSLGHVAPISTTTATGTAATNSVHASRSKDRQLLQVVLIDSSVYIIFNLILLITLMYSQFTASQTQIVNYLANIGLFSSYIPYCIGCYTNLFVSKTFRQEMENILMCK